MAAPSILSADMVRALIDESRAWPRYETAFGELLVSPAPNARHQEIVKRLVLTLGRFLEHNAVGHLILSPSDVSWGRDDVLVQPDIFIADLDEGRAFDWSRLRTVLLAIEVMSPSTARFDRFTKRILYQCMNVGAYWLVDPVARVVEVWTPNDTVPRVEHHAVLWIAPDGAHRVRIDLSVLFDGM